MKPAPSTHGAVRSSLRLGSYQLTEASYAPAAAIAEHVHLRSGWTLTLCGSYAERFRKTEALLPAGAVIAKPAAARHSNTYGPQGARCFLIGIEPDAGALARVAVHPVGPVPGIMRRIYAEFAAREAACELLLEGLLLELAAVESRLPLFRRRAAPPAWLLHVRDELQAALASPPTFASLAANAGVHPVHLSRAFRTAFGVTPGEYLRAIRIARARALLARSDRPISDIGARLGFYDQSHFTHAFKAVTGLTPLRYRRLFGAP